MRLHAARHFTRMCDVALGGGVALRSSPAGALGIREPHRYGALRAPRRHVRVPDRAQSPAPGEGVAFRMYGAQRLERGREGRLEPSAGCHRLGPRDQRPAGRRGSACWLRLSIARNPRDPPRHRRAPPCRSDGRGIAAHVRDHLPPGRRQDHADREAPALRWRGRPGRPVRARRQAKSDRQRLDGDGAPARHLDHLDRAALRARRASSINLLDTPGHADFSEDTYRTLWAADARGDGARRRQGAWSRRR